MADSHDTSGVEIWKPVAGYEGFYAISNFGVVKSLSRQVRHYRGGMLTTKERVLPGVQNSKTPHLRVKLCREGRVERCGIHQIVLTAFVGPCPDGLEGCHNDGNPLNNRLDNLRWDTRKHNAEDSIKHGTQVCGERHYKVKLTPEQVREIRQSHQAGERVKALGRRFGVTHVNIRAILDRETWKSVE